VRRTLASTSPALFFFAVLFAVGALLFVSGTWILRARATASRAHVEPEKRIELRWTQGFAPAEALSLDDRIDMIERLAMVGAPWCVETLELALREERNAYAREAAENALLIIRAR
jgi:hypothetical protein